MGWRCASCGSSRVQILQYAWVELNGDDVEVDHGSEPLPDMSVGGYWCRNCCTHPEEIYDDNHETRDLPYAGGPRKETP